MIFLPEFSDICRNLLTNPKNLPILSTKKYQGKMESLVLVQISDLCGVAKRWCHFLLVCFGGKKAVWLFGRAPSTDTSVGSWTDGGQLFYPAIWPAPFCQKGSTSKQPRQGAHECVQVPWAAFSNIL